MKLSKPLMLSPASLLITRRDGLLGDILQRFTPDLFTLDDQMTALAQAAAAIPAPDSSAAAMTTVLDALAAGTIAQLDLAETAGGDAAAITRWHRTMETLASVMDALRAEQNHRLRRATDAMVAALDATAKDVVAALRSHPVTAKGAASLDDCYDAGMADQWAEYTALRARFHETYDALGALQGAGLVEENRTVLRGPDAILTRVEDPQAVWPHYLAWRRFGPGHRFSDGTRVPREPWPHPGDDREGFLTWLLHTTAEPWVPSSERLTQRQQAVVVASRELDGRRPPSRDHNAVGNAHELSRKNRADLPVVVVGR